MPETKQPFPLSSSRHSFVRGKIFGRGIDSLDSIFKKRVSQDNEELGINSIYLPNPFLSERPLFCLIAMEPSMGKVEKFKESLNLGGMNFLHSEQDFILQYCAHHYLVKGTFSYHITDIAKGALLTKDAGVARTRRYDAWLPLLKTEIQALGNPILIAVGKKVYNYLREKEMEINYSVMHYSWSNSRRILEEGKKIEKQRPMMLRSDLEADLRDFAKLLLDRMDYSQNLKEEKLRRLFRKPLPYWKKCLFMHYELNFSEIARKMKGE